jgi:hypothetical protein
MAAAALAARHGAAQTHVQQSDAEVAGGPTLKLRPKLPPRKKPATTTAAMMVEEN